MNIQEVEKTIGRLNSQKEKLIQKKEVKIKEYENKLAELQRRLAEEKNSKLKPVEEEIKAVDAEIGKFNKVKQAILKQEAEIAKILNGDKPKTEVEVNNGYYAEQGY